MKSKLVIVTDLGHLRAYKQTPGAADRQPSLQLIDELNPPAAAEKLSDQVSDQAGRFPRGGGGAGAGAIAGDLSAGEALTREAEQEHRLIQKLAEKIDTLLADEAVTSCLLAVSAPIHKQLCGALRSKSHEKISQVLASNLASTPPPELLAHFKKAAQASAA